MDHRGRLYSKGAQLNPQGPDHFRSLVQFQERSPIKGHEKAFAWSLGEAAFAVEAHDQALTLVLTEREVISP